MTPSQIYHQIRNGCSEEEGVKLITDLLNPSSNSLERREAKFKADVYSYMGMYPADMLLDFFDYWSEPNRSRTKMLFETKPTWDTKRRLRTWASRNFAKISSQTITSGKSRKPL